MEKRFSEVLSLPQTDCWGMVFDETVEMRGHQSKYQHILDRTFRRPRDIIKFCNCVLNVFNRDIGLPNAPTKFANEHVNLAHQEYSNYLRDEIIDEIHKYYPDQKVYFEMLREIGYQQFTTSEFQPAYETWRDRMSSPKAADEILEELYEFSIIGFCRAGGSGYGGSEYVYKYLDARAEFNRSSERFRVHWGLVDSLGLKQFRIS